MGKRYTESMTAVAFALLPWPLPLPAPPLPAPPRLDLGPLTADTMHPHPPYNSPSVSSRLSLSHLLRDPSTQITLAPSPGASPVHSHPSPIFPPPSSSSSSSSFSRPAGGIIGSATSFQRGQRDTAPDQEHTSTTNQQHSTHVEDRRVSFSDKTDNTAAVPVTTSKRKRKARGADNGRNSIDPSLLGKHLDTNNHTGMGGNDWGFPPPSPLISGSGGSHAETSAQGARRTSEIGTSSSNGIPAGKRRRDSESIEPDDDRPLAITCAPCRARKISESSVV